MAARFAPVDLTADVSTLPDNERQALAKLVEAAKVFDALFLRQVWEGNETMLLDLVRDGSPLGRARLHYFLINKGPWSRLDHNEPFIAGAPPKPPQANFYPAGATKEEVEAWIEGAVRRRERARATGFFTTIRRGAGRQVHRGAVHARIPGRARARRGAAARSGGAHHAADAEELSREARRGAAEQRLLRQRRRLDGARRQHRADDRPVRDLRGRVVQLQGGVRGVHHAARRRRDAEAGAVRRPSCRRSRTTCRSIPKYRNPKLGALAPIRVVNTVFSSGDGNRGVQTAAFNLPNDERVITEKGSKRVMLKNNQEAKFRMVLQPIAKVALRRRRSEARRRSTRSSRTS